MKHPFVFSFPRSGLHLTSTIIGWDLFVDFKMMYQEKGIIEKINQKNKEVLFTHKTTKMLSFDCINFILKETKPIFIVRDPKDALVSWYHLLLKSPKRPNFDAPSIDKYLLEKFSPNPKENIIENRIILWRDHIRGFRKYESKLHVIRYEKLIRGYHQESKRLSEYLDLEIRSDLPSLSEVDMSRKGIIGDHKNLLSDDLIEKIDSICSQEIKYINSLN